MAKAACEVPRVSPLHALARRPLGFLVATAALVTGCAPAPAAHWGYAPPEDPSRWADLSPDFKACRTGAHQSPIDLPKAGGPLEAPALSFSYQPFPLAIYNNGHAIQITAAGGSSISLGPGPDDRYELVQFHMHTPAEHKVAGQGYDMELHLVHKNAAGQLAVVGLLFQKGADNPLLAPITDHAPKEISKEGQAVRGIEVDVSKLLPAQLDYYSYDGSLTAPPCSETVKWFVMTAVGTIGPGQLAKLEEAGHGPNARPVQPVRGQVSHRGSSK